MGFSSGGRLAFTVPRVPETAFDVNVRGTFHVIMEAIRNRVPRVVYSSSASVYGDAVEFP
jgi:UDP-glucose 4-epimerase